jgi:hypothetical protein
MDNDAQQQQQEQQQQGAAEDTVQPMQSACGDSDDGEQKRTWGQPCSDTGQHVSVESALALLTAALARPDVPAQHRARPASAASSQQISAACSLARPQSARATCSSSRTSVATSLKSAELCKLQQQYTAVHNISQGSSVLHTFRSNTSSASTSSSTSNGSSQRVLYAAPGSDHAAARPRPASAPRLRGHSGGPSSNTDSSSHRVSNDGLVRPRSSDCSRRGSNAANINKTGSNTPASGAVACSSRQCSAYLQQPDVVTASHNISSGSSMRRLRSNTCTRVRETDAAESNTAVHRNRQHTQAGTVQAATLHTASAMSAGVQASSSRGSSMSLVAAAVQEATAALDAAVTATSSTVATPRLSAQAVTGVAAGGVDCHNLAGSQQMFSSRLQEVCAGMKSSHGLTTGPLQSSTHSTMVVAADDWQHRQWHPRQQLHQQTQLPQQQGDMPNNTLAARSTCLARFSSFQGGRVRGQASPTISKTMLQESKFDYQTAAASTLTAYCSTMLAGQLPRCCHQQQPLGLHPTAAALCIPTVSSSARVCSAALAREQLPAVCLRCTVRGCSTHPVGATCAAATQRCLCCIHPAVQV